MKAIICDRCSAMWKDRLDCDIHVQTYYISNGGSHSDKIGEWDLCEQCKEGLFNYLRPIDNKNKGLGKEDSHE